LEINWSFIDDEYSAVGNIHTEYDISGEYSYHGENSSWGSGSYTEENYWNTWENESASSRTSWEEMGFHHECDEHYEWSLDETDRVYVSDYSYEQTGSMSSNGYRGGSGTYNYESSNYTQGEGWSSLTHSGSYGSSSFHDEYDFTASWSESFDGVTEVYSSAHSATNNVSGDIYNMNGYFSDYYNTYEGQSPDSGGYGDSYPSSDSYASTTSSPSFSFTWDGWNVQSKQGVYIHNSPYSGEYSIPYGLGSWSNPVEQPNSAYSTTPETPAPYTTPSQRYVDDIDDFFYGYDNTPMYETAEQEYGEITVTNASGSASYSNTSDFHEDFSNGEIGNEGVGSGLEKDQKQTIYSNIETITYAHNGSRDQLVDESYRDDWTDWINPGSYGYWWGIRFYSLFHYNEANELRQKERAILGEAIVNNRDSVNVQQYLDTYKAPTETVTAITTVAEVDLFFISTAVGMATPKANIPVSKVYPPKYPPNNGFVEGTEHTRTLVVGEVIERRNSARGRYVAPEGSNPETLGIQEFRFNSPVQKYRVKKEFSVQTGTAANAFGQNNGGGTQILLDRSVLYYKNQGYLERIE